MLGFFFNGDFSAFKESSSSDKHSPSFGRKVVREGLRTELSKNCGISCGLIVSESAVLLFYFAYLVDSILLEVDKMIIPTKLGCLHI